MTPKQRDLQIFIQHEIARTGQSPTMEAIAEALGLSSRSRAHALVSDLVNTGHLARSKNRARGITVRRPIPDDRFEAAAKAVCAALDRAPNTDNVTRATAALMDALVTEGGPV